MAFRKVILPAAAVLVVVALLLGGGQPEEIGPAGVVISEFMASNDHTLTDEDGEHSDWIEIHNPGRRAVDLAGWYLTDDPEQPSRWRFPPITLASGEYLIVFASGKNRAVAGAELHASFRLSAGGEYLALVHVDGVSIAHDFAPEYPEQRSDISYGLGGGEELYFSPATPGADNGDGYTGFASGVAFSHEHGFFQAPFLVTLTTPTGEATIRYTLDGSPPGESTGIRYDEPVPIETTTCLRAVAFADTRLPSPVATRTYIFPGDVERQPSRPAGFRDA